MRTQKEFSVFRKHINSECLCEFSSCYFKRSNLFLLQDESGKIATKEFLSKIPHNDKLSSC